MEKQNILDRFNESPDEKKRPTAITAICIIGFLGALVTVPMIFSEAARLVGGWYPPYLALSSVVGLACMVALWKMKKIGVYAYTGMAIVNQVVLLAMGVWNIMALIIPAAVIAIALSHVDKMD